MTQTQNHPGLKDRLIAFGYDYLLISAYLVALSGVSYFLMRSSETASWDLFFSNPIRADLVAFLTTILPVSVYYAVTESSANQGSWGKLKRRLKVESIDGNRISFGRAFFRSLLKFIPWQIAHTCLFNIPGWPFQPESAPLWVDLGLILVWVLVGVFVIGLMVDKDHRTLYDHISGTRVSQSL